MDQIAVLGGSGTLGKSITDQLIIQNMKVKILVRNMEKYKSLYPNGKPPGRVNVIEGVLDSNIALAQVLEYCDTIFICFDTEYANQDKNMTRWISRVADIGSAMEAHLLFPGNKYNFQPSKEISIPIIEETPQNSNTKYGQLRIALEQRLGRASLEGAKVSIVRFPTVFGPANFDVITGQLFTSAISNKQAVWYGDEDKEFEFIYSYDAAKAMIQAARSEQATDKILHHSGYRIKPIDFIKKIYQQAGFSLDNLDIASRMKLLVKSKLQSKLKIILDQYDHFVHPVYLDSKRYSEYVADIDLTDIDIAIHDTVDWYKNWFQAQNT